MGNLVSGRKIPVIAVVLALVAVAAFLAVSQFGSTATADGSEISDYVGFWMAVDPSDGGFNKLSITDNGDDTAKVGLSETFVSTCDGGRGKLSGLGEVNEDGDLAVPITIQCLKPKKNDPMGDPVGPFTVTFEVLGDNLIEFQFGPTFRVPYHKVSND